MKLGYQIPNFTYPGTAADIVPAVLAQAREAESSGFDTVLVMDHFYQLPGIGKSTEPMLEAYTLLAAIAGATTSINLSTLVTGNTYRNPAMLAKTVTTLDMVSAGRAVLAIGAGWYELEHNQMGYTFGTFTDRFERLTEALHIIEPMLRGRQPSLDGKWYTASETVNNPRLRDDLPIMLGGGGEKKTFGLAARYADHLNIICSPGELPRKLDALAARCAEAKRNRATLETSFLVSVFIDEDGDVARKQQRDFLANIGVDIDSLEGDEREMRIGRQLVGTPDEVAEQAQAKVLDSGVDGIVVHLLASGHVPGTVELTAKALAPLTK